MKTARPFTKAVAGLLALSFALSVVANAAPGDGVQQSWLTAARHSAGIAPDPAAQADTAIVQVYAAPTYGWRGLFAVHPWIIFKRTGAKSFTRYDVIGWRGTDVVQRNYALPDGLWYGATPTLLVDQRGDGVEAMIDEIEAAIKSYPYAHRYQAYPGPNSNTFLAISAARFRRSNSTCRPTPSARTTARWTNRSAARLRAAAYRRRCSACSG